MTALVITRSSAPDARVARTDWPMPSRITLPPPNFASSPAVVRSRSTRMNSSVSATVRSSVRRPWFAMMSPSPSRYSPGITVGLLADRMMNGDELGAVGKGALDLHLLEHLRHSLHHVVAAEDVEAGRHQVGDAPAVANPLQNFGGDQRQRFGVVQLETAATSPARDFGGGEHEELLLLTRGEVHRRAS